jgi:hypothetical protein
MATRVTYPLFKAFTSVVTFGIGYKLYTYEAGTSTLLTTYKDDAGTVPHTNPIILDSLGQAEIFITQAAKFTLTDSDDNIQTGWPVDNIDPRTTTAEQVSFEPAGDITSENVQDAVEEIDAAVTALTSESILWRSREVIGGEIDVQASSSIAVAPLECMSSDFLTHIKIDEITYINLSVEEMAGPPVLRVFAYKDDGGVCGILLDSDPDGANLTDPNIVGLRKIGFVAIYGEDIIDRSQNGDYVACLYSAQNLISAAITTTPEAVDHSDMIAEEMVELVEYGCSDDGTAGVVYAIESGSYVSFVVGTTITTAAATNENAWGNSASMKAGLKPYVATRRFRSSTGTLNLLLQGYKLKR